jgi:hypothetical protein
MGLFPQALASSPLFCLFQNEKCHLLVEHETQKLKALDESHNQSLKEWRDKLRPRKKVLHWTHGYLPGTSESSLFSDSCLVAPLKLVCSRETGPICLLC